MPVTNPASFSSIQTNFPGSNNFSDYPRGGAYVPVASSATISTTANGLAMSQFNGVTKPSALSATVTPATTSASTTQAGTAVTLTSPMLTATGAGGGTYTYAWTLVSTSNSTAPTINTPTARTTTVSSRVTTCTDDGTGTLSGTAIVNVRCTITSAGLTAADTASISFYQSYVACVAFDSIMTDGRQAGEYTVGNTLVVTDPSDMLFNSGRGEILAAWTATVPGVRITTALGAVLECSTTAPIPVLEGGFVFAPDLYDRYIPTASREDIDDRHTRFLWDRVVLVEPIAHLLVRGMYVTNRCFWASKDGKRFVLHHNAKPIAPP